MGKQSDQGLRCEMLMHSLTQKPIKRQTATRFFNGKKRSVNSFVLLPLLLSFSGCTATWFSRAADLKTVWVDRNTYNRFSIGMERRHHTAPPNHVIHGYRWLHGPVGFLKPTPVAGSATDLRINGTHSMIESVPNQAVISESMPRALIDDPTVDKAFLVPESSAPEVPSVPSVTKPPVEIMPPPSETWPQSQTNELEEKGTPKPKPIAGPTAFSEEKRTNLRVQPAGYRKASQRSSTASLLYPRP